MRRPFIFLLLLKIVFSSLTGCFANEETSLTFSNPTTFKQYSSLLPVINKKDVAVALVIDVDGEVYMWDFNSRKVVWSWSSGFPIYASYQNFNETNASEPVIEYADIDDDWQLYFYRRNPFTKVKPSKTVEDYIRSTPHVSKDGGVTVGSRRSTVYLVDANTGKLIRTYNLADTPSVLGFQNEVENQVMLKEDAKEFLSSGAEDSETVEQLLYITRTDYALQHHSPVTGKVLWNVAFSDFDATFKFPHEVKPVILRIRDHSWKKSLSLYDKRFNGFPGGSPLPLPKLDSELSLVPVPFSQIPIASKHTTSGQVLALPSPSNENNGVNDSGVTEMIFMTLTAGIVARFPLQYIIPFLPTQGYGNSLFYFAFMFVIGFIFHLYVKFRKQNELKKTFEEFKVQVAVPKKKKTRRLGNKKGNANNEKSLQYTNDDYKAGDAHDEGSKNNFLLTFTDTSDRIDGRRIGKLVVSSKEIAKGSNGTVVLEGIYDSRSVAVKRLVRTHHDVALKEIQNLIASDQHPNVVRWYGVEYDQDFVYLSLERCICSLNDLIYICSKTFQSQVTAKDQDLELVDEYTLQLYSIQEKNMDVELWKANGYPSLQLLKLLRDVVSGIVHLHELGIIHRDLKPQNVLINKDRFLTAKLSDMGISKKLPGDQSSITQHATGYGSSGWQAPEQLLHQRQTRAVDLFSLGCVLFFCVTGGKHPYGDNIERDVNIVNDRKDLFLVENMPEAMDLFTRLLDPNPDLRPKAMDVLHHPFFWSSEMRLSFLRDTSDRVELEDRENESELLNALESTAAVAVNGKWDEKLEAAFINNIGRYRRYKYGSVRDLLRVIRNKLNHYRELPREIQELLGPVPEGFDGYFSSRFPRLLIEVYKVMLEHCVDEEFFLKYTTTNLM
ncbi:serine/threonine-protein kinase/endoribonuclease IRE1b-like [Humulus lupulus]|uniref:serine/threonine-protein kinase/endoribonuclease IRE1b-like n=1 Tax=Humulus lupulus TaxID=3486 RepID=UPI002B416564|nr:serine/threonine-protein kinase/endoribonuclease IRE1b-like [Humulus lupulus]